MLGFLVAGVIAAVVNKGAAARHLGGWNLLLSNPLGATIGVVTPMSCCSAVPTAMALYRAGSRRGPACAFLIATPWFNWYGLAALVIFLGPRVAVAVAGSTVLVAFTAGARPMRRDHPLSPHGQRRPGARGTGSRQRWRTAAPAAAVACSRRSGA